MMPSSGEGGEAIGGGRDREVHRGEGGDDTNDGSFGRYRLPGRTNGERKRNGRQHEPCPAPPRCSESSRIAERTMLAPWLITTSANGRTKPLLLVKGGRRLIPYLQGRPPTTKEANDRSHHSRRSLTKLSRANCSTSDGSEGGDERRTRRSTAPTIGGADEPSERKFGPGGSPDRMGSPWPKFWPNGRIRPR